MYERVRDVSDQQLISLSIADDLVLVRAGGTAYGTIVFGRIRLPCVDDGFVHVRVHDPPDEERSSKDVVFHSLYTEEGRERAEDAPIAWRAILSESDALEFSDE